MVTSVRLCLPYDLLNAILSLSKFVYFNKNLYCCLGRRHDVTCAHRKCNVKCEFLSNNSLFGGQL